MSLVMRLVQHELHDQRGEPRGQRTRPTGMRTSVVLTTVVILAVVALAIAVGIALMRDDSSDTPTTKPSPVASVSTSLPILSSPVVHPSAHASPIR